MLTCHTFSVRLYYLSKLFTDTDFNTFLLEKDIWSSQRLQSWPSCAQYLHSMLPQSQRKYRTIIFQMKPRFTSPGDYGLLGNFITHKVLWVTHKVKLDTKKWLYLDTKSFVSASDTNIKDHKPSKKYLSPFRLRPKF